MSRRCRRACQRERRFLPTAYRFTGTSSSSKRLPCRRPKLRRRPANDCADVDSVVCWARLRSPWRDVMGTRYTYMPGFGNDFETEALPGALPIGQNSPQRCAYGLYAEQLSGSPFTAPRGANERSWLYRMRPSVRHTGRFKPASYPQWKTAPNLNDHELALGQYRWSPVPMPTEPTDFIAGMRTITTAG